MFLVEERAGARRQARILAGVVGVALQIAGCGGGGESSPPPASAAPTATISGISPSVLVVNESVSFTAVQRSDITGYAWNFGDGSSASGPSVTHSFTALGGRNVELTVTNAQGLTGRAASAVTVHGRPTTPVILGLRTTWYPGAPLTLTASATDPEGLALSYTWDMGDGTTRTGAQVTHVYGSAGVQQLRVTATSSVGLLSVGSATQSITGTPMGAPTAGGSTPQHLLGQSFYAQGFGFDPNGFAVTLGWDFGDGTTAQGGTAAHRYAIAGNYVARLTARSETGATTFLDVPVTVRAPVALPVPVDNTLTPYCSGPFCGAADVDTYAGSGIGVWRYHNATASEATLDLRLDGPLGGRHVALVFSNGTLGTSPTLPSAGLLSVTGSDVAPAGARMSAQSAAGEEVVDGHTAVLEANYAMARSLPAPDPAAQAAAVEESRKRIAAAPPNGTVRQWLDLYSGVTNYSMRVATSCVLPDGRNAIFWLDNSRPPTTQLDTKIAQLAASFCGGTGSYARLTARVGAPWGVAANAYPALIHDGAQLQNIHVVLPWVPQSTSWGGYFASTNLLNAASTASTNEALALFINGRRFESAPVEDHYEMSALVHELQHLVNYYQRTVTRSAVHPVWLEEVTAMMAEDVVPPAVTDAFRTDQRLAGLAASGGGIGLVGWTNPEGGSYNYGGALGGFLHREYGLGLDRWLVESCVDSDTNTAVACLDDLSRQRGGSGFADELARLGATVYGGMPLSGLPRGFGFNALQEDGYLLAPTGTQVMLNPVLSVAPRVLTSGFIASAQTYQIDHLSAGGTLWQRNGVKVPARTTLMIVVQ